MPEQIHNTQIDMALPSRTELPARVGDLLPDWDKPGSLCVIWSFDGYFVAANARYFHVFGWAKPELLGASYWDFIHPADQHALVEAIERLMTAGGLRTGYVLRRLCRDGSYRWARWDIVADRDSELLYGVGADISDQKLRPEPERVAVGTWVRDIPAATLTWSDELYGMYGLPVRTPLTDALIKSRIHPQDHPLVDGAWRASLADSDAHSARFRAVWPDGTVRHLTSTGRVTARSGRHAITVRGVTIDITDHPE